MKKGNFRTKRIYPKNSEIKFVIEARANNVWKILGSGDKQLIFDSEQDAVNSLISIFQFVKYFSRPAYASELATKLLKTRP